MLHKENNKNIPAEIPGLLSCISNGEIVYDDYEVLYCNPEGFLLLDETSSTISEDMESISFIVNSSALD